MGPISDPSNSQTTPGQILSMVTRMHASRRPVATSAIRHGSQSHCCGCGEQLWGSCSLITARRPWGQPGDPGGLSGALPGLRGHRSKVNMQGSLMDARQGPGAHFSRQYCLPLPLTTPTTSPTGPQEKDLGQRKEDGLDRERRTKNKRRSYETADPTRSPE